MLRICLTFLTVILMNGFKCSQFHYIQSNSFADNLFKADGMPRSCLNICQKSGSVCL